MDTCGGGEHGTQIVRAAQFNFDAPPTWLAIHILPSLPSSMLAYGPTQEDLSLLILEPLPPAARPRAAYVLSISRSLGIWCAVVSQGVHDHLECG